jgi:ribosomal 50S subunit-recycling heat shock protein
LVEENKWNKNTRKQNWKTFKKGDKGMTSIHREIAKKIREVNADDIIELLRENMPPEGWRVEFYLDEDGNLNVTGLIGNNNWIEYDEDEIYLCYISGEDLDVSEWYPIGVNWIVDESYAEEIGLELTEEQKEMLKDGHVLYRSDLTDEQIEIIEDDQLDFLLGEDLIDVVNERLEESAQEEERAAIEEENYREDEHGPFN